jgi:biopolymer transport protein ExbD
MKVKRGQRRRPRMEMIPLMDITFNLLSFFVYISLFMVLQRGVPIRLPQADTAETARYEAITVSVDAQGRIFLEGRPVPRAELTSAIVDEIHSTKRESVILRADGGASYQVVVEALDSIRMAGITKVSLEAEPRGAQ